MPYTWPTELDDAARLLTVVGSFWAETYAGNDLVASLLHAKAQHHAQAHLDLLELLAAVSRFTVPVFHAENWSLLLLAESERNSPNLPTWDGTYTFAGQIQYDTPTDRPLFAWPAPPGLVDAAVVVDRITAATVTRTAGVDFVTEPGVLRFRTDPFADPNAVVAEVFTDGVVTDRVLALWAYSGRYDLDTVYRQFGYAIGLRLRSSPAYRRLVNAVFDGLTAGTTVRCIQDFMAAVCDVPLAEEDETVQYVLTDAKHKTVVTPRHAYRLSTQATVTVEPGTALAAGDPLCDGLLFYEFNRGEVPSASQVAALAVGRGLLGPGFFRELVFENKTVPLLVVEGVNGYTRVEFEVGGLPTDVEKFWDDVHAQGVSSGDTLAMRLDARPTKVGQPTQMALPATVNPLGFLLQNYFRGNLVIVVVRPAAFGPDASGLHAARLLRKLMPPWVACVIMVRHEATDEVDPDELVEEAVDTYQGESLADEIDPAAFVEDELRAVQIGGQCQ